MSKTIYAMLSLFFIQKLVMADYYSDCDSSAYHETSPSACETLQVTINNKTNYVFTLDPSSLQVRVGSTASIASQLAANNPTTFTLTGTPVSGTQSYDEIDETFSYYPTANSQSNGPIPRNAKVAFHLTKASCNTSQASCRTQRYCCNPIPSWLGGGCADSLDAAAKRCYHWYGVNCEVTSATSANQSNVFSSGETDKLYYTTTNTNGSFPSCSEEKVCPAYDKHKGCPQTTITGSQAATSAFTIYPAILTQLIITFPFNNQSLMGHVVLNATYSNLKATLLSSLTTFNVVPVSMETDSLVFSGLCDNQQCPEAVQ